MKISHQLRIISNKLEELEENKDTLKKKEIFDIQMEIENKLIDILNKWIITD